MPTEIIPIIIAGAAAGWLVYNPNLPWSVWIALALVVFASWRPARLLLGSYLFGAISTALKRGLIQALIVQKAYDMGAKAVTDAVAYLKTGKKPPALTQPTYVIATKANIAKPEIAKYVYRVKG